MLSRWTKLPLEYFAGWTELQKMERNDVANLTRIANYLKVQPGKIEINKEKVDKSPAIET